MRTIYFFTISIFIAVFSLSAQDITGKWYGQADVGAMKLRINFTIDKSGDGYSATMKSPDQGSPEIPATQVTWGNNEINISIAPLNFTYKGALKEDSIEGSFNQMGATFPLNLSREEIRINRPQEPKPPYPYKEEDITFRNEAMDIKLSGTLTIPDKTGKYPAVVMVTGSGPQDRNEEIMGHKPFLVIADHLTRHGIAVLRYDECGVGESEGNYGASTIPSFADDAAAAITYLKTRADIDPQKIGVIGHSEGGAVAVMLASKKIPAFIISLAGPGVNGCEVMRSQREAILRLSGFADNYITQYNGAMAQIEELILNAVTEKEVLTEKTEAIIAGTPLAGQAEILIRQMTTPAMISLLRYDPAVYFKSVTCPVLALNGDKDVQVIAKPNLEGFKQITVNGNKQVTIKEYPDLNHMFQTAKTGLPTEYGQIEETINPVVMKDITEWILNIY